jgi:outer membrane murein-binding lipoprotein Lpp
VSTSTVAVGVGAGATVLAAETLTTAVGRAVLIAVCVLAVTALVRWVWRAITNQLDTQLDAKLDAKIDALGEQIESKIGELSSQAQQRESDTNARLATLERTRVDPAVLQHIFTTLDTLSKSVAAIRGRTFTADDPAPPEGNQP